MKQYRAAVGFALGALAFAWSTGARADEGVAPPPPPTASPWYDAISFKAFVDAYASVNYNFPKPQTGTNALRAYDVNNGASLAWVGLDASYDPAPVGGTVSLRFGPSAAIYAGARRDTYGLEYVKQAYASWKPADKLQLDFGKFDTIYGAEVAESQNNFNYTRGALYWLAQPLFHTGLRASYAMTDELALKALVVNGWNNTVDNNVGKSYGLQLGFTPSDTFSAYLGWIGGPEQPDSASVDCAADTAYDSTTGACAAAPGAVAQSYNVDCGGANQPKAWRHLIDLVVSVNPTPDLGIVLNGDYGTQGLRDATNATNDVTTQTWYGAALMARYQLTPVWALAARGEYVHDKNDFFGTGRTQSSIVTGTLTIEAKPSDNLVIRLDARDDTMVEGDMPDGTSDKKLFQKKLRDMGSSQLTTTLGIVVTTN